MHAHRVVCGDDSFNCGLYGRYRDNVPNVYARIHMLLGGILLDCDRVHYLPMPSPFICGRTSLSLEHQESMVGKIPYFLEMLPRRDFISRRSTMW